MVLLSKVSNTQKLFLSKFGGKFEPQKIYFEGNDSSGEELASIKIYQLYQTCFFEFSAKKMFYIETYLDRNDFSRSIDISQHFENIKIW